MMRFRVVVCAMLATLFAGAPASAQAQAWPAKPIRWLVPFPPGGPADIIARVMAQKLSERVGQPGVVENRAGAGGNVAHEAAARATPDGYTVVFVVPSIVTNPYFMKVSVDPFKELAPVIHLDNASMVLLAHPGYPAKNVAEVLAQIRAKPGAASCGISGALPQVGCEMLRAAAGVDMILVQYKGNAPALNAVVSGEVNMIFDVVNTAIGQVKSGRARAIASTRPKRGGALFSDLAVMSETIPEFDLVTWHGVMAPRGTPRDVVLRLNRELAGVLEQPDVHKRLTEQGLEITAGPVEAFEEVLKRDYSRYGRILTRAGIKPE